jgi:ABC-type anion transport system duplicated permease subunit
MMFSTFAIKIKDVYGQTGRKRERERENMKIRFYHFLSSGPAQIVFHFIFFCIFSEIRLKSVFLFVLIFYNICTC